MIPSAFSKAKPELELLEDELLEEELLEEELLEEELLEEELLEDELLDEELLEGLSFLDLPPPLPQPTTVNNDTESSANKNLFIIHTPHNLLISLFLSDDRSLFTQQSQNHE